MDRRLLHHFVRIARFRLVRFRLETFGLYYPAVPEQAPWWRPKKQALDELVYRLPSYVHWVGEMVVLRRGGARGWWREQLGPRDDARWRANLARLNRPDALSEAGVPVSESATSAAASNAGLAAAEVVPSPSALETVRAEKLPQTSGSRL